MSSNDKAKQKLMESMRMTRASSGEKAGEADKKQNAGPQDNKSVKKKKKIAATKVVPTGVQKSVVDPYQIVRRIWPD